MLKKEIKNSIVKEENEIIRTLILQNLSTKEIIEKKHILTEVGSINDK